MSATYKDITSKPEGDLKKNGISLDWINIVINTFRFIFMR